MLSSQANAKLDMLSFENPASKYSRDLKQDMELMEDLFDAKKFSGEDNEDESGDEEDEEDFNTNLERDLCELFCHKEKMFDVPKFESLLNGYAKMSSSIIGVERVIDAFKKTSKATRDDLKPSELVG